MTAALRLADLGVEVLLVEAEDVPKTDWRASTFHCATLEVLEATGIVPQMLELGLKAHTYDLRDRSSGVVATFDFSLLEGDTDYPYRLQLNQQRVVGLLHDRLRTHPLVELSFGSRLVGYTSNDRGVRVELERSTGIERRDGAFLFGADGAASSVRRLMGVGFEGVTYPERFLIVSIAEDLAARLTDLALVNYVADPVEWLFILRTPESWRVLFPIPAGEPEEWALSDESIERRLQGVALSGDRYQLLDRQLYMVHQRVADSFASRRVLLMGDAAHINSPIGGVGLNSGIHDAADAAARIARVLSDDLDPRKELQTYSRVRRRVALDYVQRDTHANTVRLAETDGARRWRELSAMAEIAADAERARSYLWRVSLLEPLRRYGIGRLPDEVTTPG